jgi:CheY-like chemotaxis protein
MLTVLVIDDNEEFRQLLCTILLDNEFDVRDVDCPEGAFNLLRTEKVDLIICDIHMPFTTGPSQKDFEQSNRVGVRTIEELRWVFPEMPIIAVTAAMPLDLAKIKREVDGVPTLSKPFSPEQLLVTIEHLTSSPIGNKVLQ